MFWSDCATGRLCRFFYCSADLLSFGLSCAAHEGAVDHLLDVVRICRLNIFRNNIGVQLACAENAVLQSAIQSLAAEGIIFYSYGFSYHEGFSIPVVIKTLLSVCRMFSGGCDYSVVGDTPLFGNGSASPAAVSLFALSGIQPWLKITFVVLIDLVTLNGIAGVILARFDRPVWNRHRIVTGMAMSVICVGVFIGTRQPYAGIVCFSLLVIKAWLIFKGKQ